MLTTQRYSRKPFYVEAVQVTGDNMKQVAEWCDGEIVLGTITASDFRIKVPVRRPLNDRQMYAHPGDWVLKAGSGFKAYTDRAFQQCFEPYTDEDGWPEHFTQVPGRTEFPLEKWRQMAQDMGIPLVLPEWQAEAEVLAGKPWLQWMLAEIRTDTGIPPGKIIIISDLHYPDQSTD